MKTVTAKESSERWVRKSLKAYLEGKQNFKWIQGILRGMNKGEVEALLSSLGQCGLIERRNELDEYLNS